MATNLKFEMALVIARKIVESGEFPELHFAASGMLNPVYTYDWSRRLDEWEKDEISYNFWPTIKKRLPEILEKISL